jgi:hypothetical protein
MMKEAQTYLAGEEAKKSLGRVITIDYPPKIDMEFGLTPGNYKVSASSMDPLIAKIRISVPLREPGKSISPATAELEAAKEEPKKKKK